MGMPWLRLYTDVIDDEKLGLLAFEDRWHYVAILACKGKGILDKGDSHEMMLRKVAFKLGLTPRELVEVARRLSEVGLIDRDTLQPCGWDDRQFESDKSAARTRAYRERKAGKEHQNVTVTDAKRHGDVTVTAQDTDTDTEAYSDTDTDTEKERTDSEEITGVGAPIAESAPRPAPPTPAPPSEKTSSASATLPPAPRKSATRLPEEWALPKAWGDWALDERPDMTAEDVRKEGECFADYWHAKAGADARKADWLATWRNWVRRASGGGGRLAPNRGRPDNSQQAIEERNRAVLAQWAQGSSDH